METRACVPAIELIRDYEKAAAVVRSRERPSTIFPSPVVVERFHLPSIAFPFPVLPMTSAPSPRCPVTSQEHARIASAALLPPTPSDVHETCIPAEDLASDIFLRHRYHVPFPNLFSAYMIEDRVGCSMRHGKSRDWLLSTILIWTAEVQGSHLGETDHVRYRG